MTAILLDLFGLLILGYNVLRGLTTGLIRTSVGAIAVVVASYSAWQLQGLAGPFVDPFVPPTWPLAFLVTPLVVWLVAFGAINMVGILLRWTVSVTPLVIADRIGGAIFGLVTGLTILVTPLLLIGSFPLLQQIPWIQDALSRSAIASLLSPVVQWVLELAPLGKI